MINMGILLVYKILHVNTKYSYALHSHTHYKWRSQSHAFLWKETTKHKWEHKIKWVTTYNPRHITFQQQSTFSLNTMDNPKPNHNTHTTTKHHTLSWGKECSSFHQFKTSYLPNIWRQFIRRTNCIEYSVVFRPLFSRTCDWISTVTFASEHCTSKSTIPGNTSHSLQKFL